MRKVKTAPVSGLAIESVPIESLIPHPRNARQGDLGAVIESVKQNGCYRPLVVQKSTRYILAGNHLWRALQAVGQDRADVTFIDCDEDRALRILLVDNRTNDLASYDNAALAELLQSLPNLDGTGFDADALDELLADLAKPFNLSDEAEKNESDDQSAEIYALREDAIFPSTNKWGIPDLREDMLSEQVPHKVWSGGAPETVTDLLFIYRTAKFPPEAEGGVLAFYVDDWRFENLWNDAVKVVEQLRLFGWGSIVTPDFSVWRDDPLAVQLFNLYRSRWCARYWQEAGIRIIPSLNWSDERSYEFANAGIPRDVPVASVQCRTTRSRKGKEYFVAGIANAITTVKPKTLLIYGGVEGRAWIEDGLPDGPEYIWLDNWMGARKRARKGNGNETAECAA